MSKQGLDIERSIQRALKAGKRGWPQVTLDSSGKVMSRTHQYACYCLSRELMSDNEICPAHRRLIGTHPARTQNLGLRR